MIFDDSLLLGLYAIPFLFALIFPGIRSLGVALAVVIIGAFLLVMTGSGGGVGYALGLAFLVLVVLGFISGAIVRSISFRWAQPSREPLKFFALAIVGFLLPPIAVAGPSEMTKWLTRPSTGTCEASTFKLSMAARILNVPGAPVFSLADDSGEMPVSFYSGQRSKGFEKFCAEYLKAPKPLNKTLSIQTWVLGSSNTKDWINEHCNEGQTGIDSFICGLRKKSYQTGIIDSAVIFDPKVSNATNQQDVYAVDKVLNEKLTESENDPDGDLRLVMVCDNYHAGVKTCSAAGVLDNGLGYRFRIYTAEAVANHNAWAVRKKLDKFTDELAKPLQ